MSAAAGSADSDANITWNSSDARLVELCDLNPELAALPFVRWQVALQPWWLIFVSSIVWIVLSYGANAFFDHTKMGKAIMRCIGKCWYENNTAPSSSHAAVGTNNPCNDHDDPEDSELEMGAATPGRHVRSDSVESSSAGAPGKDLPHLSRGDSTSLSSIAPSIIHPAAPADDRGATHLPHVSAIHVAPILKETYIAAMNMLKDPIIKWTLQPPSFFMFLQLLLQISHAIYVFSTLHSGSQSSWHTYEEFYTRILNGGGAACILPFFYARTHSTVKPATHAVNAPVHIHLGGNGAHHLSSSSSYASAGSGATRYRWRDHAVDYLLNLYNILLLPALITHGLLIYVMLPLLGIFILLMFIISRAHWTLDFLARQTVAVKTCFLVLTIGGLQLFITILVQHAMTYGVLLYQGDNYFSLIAREFQYRNMQLCYEKALQHPTTFPEMIFSFISVF